MRVRTFHLFLAIASVLMAASPILGTERIVVRDLSGARVAPLDAAKQKATVLIFITTDCPIANACAPEIERIFRAYSPKQIGFYLVYVDASQRAEDARSHHREYRYTCPAVLDPDHKLVKR